MTNLEPYIKRVECRACGALPGQDCKQLYPGRGIQRLTHTARYVLAKRRGELPKADDDSA